jgi:hypothetical protein
MRTTVLIAISLSSHLLGSALLAEPSSHRATEPPTPTLALTPTTVEAAGMSPGGDVVVVGAMSYWKDGVSYRWHGAESLADGDLDGAASWTPDVAIARLAVWAAIDLETGASATALGVRPDERRLRLSQGPIVRTGVDGGTLFTLPAGDYQIALVRPGVGAWSGLTQPGEARSVELPAAEMRTLGVGREGELSPKAGDVVAIFDLEQVRVLVKVLVSGDFAIPQGKEQ